MVYLALFIVALVLFLGFLSVTAIEKKRGSRFFSPQRATLDATASRVSDGLRHVDFSAFVWHLARDISSRIVHDVAHVSLIVVRWLERLLTRIVRYLRGKALTPQVPSEGRRSAFVETITYFKKTLRRSKETTKDKTEV